MDEKAPVHVTTTSATTSDQLEADLLLSDGSAALDNTFPYQKPFVDAFIHPRTYI